MKTLKLIVSGIFAILTLMLAQQAKAQFMPVVFDNTYGKGNQFNTACADFQSGDIVIAGVNGGKAIIAWFDRVGENRFTKTFSADEFSLINKVIALSEDKVLVIGRRTAAARENKPATGRAMIINSQGVAERAVQVGVDGTCLVSGQLLSSGNMILSGSSPSGSNSNAFICKVNSSNKIVYEYTSPVGEICEWFDVLGSRSEYVNAAFSAKEREGSAVVRLDENGKPFFITSLPDPTFKIENMASSNEGDVYITGRGNQAGGAVIKIRPEGDIVFQRNIAPASSQTQVANLLIFPSGEIFVGGNDNRNAFYSLLRSDGTELLTNVDDGKVASIAGDFNNGECIVSIFDPSLNRGKVVKISRRGNRLYEKATAANYTSMSINGNGDLLLASPQTGRLSMLSNLGELLFDRFVVENSPTEFSNVYLPANGEALFMNHDSRLAKLAHGIYVSDFMVTEPINGMTSAVFMVTLSGYSFNREGALIPATVDFKTRPVTAVEGENFRPVSGTLSFIPASDGSNRHFSKFVVEVPVSANNKLEGLRTFALDLSNVNQSYLIKSSSTASIEDQPAIVRMIRSTPGVEGSKDVVLELGLFKRDGTAITNETRTDVVIDGIYGNGSADRLDFDMGRIPRLVIPSGTHSGTFSVLTLEDTRYEAEKTVVVNFNKIYAMSDTDVSFGSNLLTCNGAISDQPAKVVIESLGNRKHNNVMSGFFKVSLLRAKDGALQTNNSGSDIVLETAISSSSTAKQGENFAISNAHDLRISADGRSSAVNLNGIVLFAPNSNQKTVVMNLTGVQAGENAGPISVSSDRNTAKFSIIE